MAEEIKEYEIRTVADFLIVPEERIIDCLVDFTIWLQLARQPETIENALTEIFSAKAGQIKSMPDVFRWRNDGKTGLSHVQLISSETGKPICRLELTDD